MKPMRAVLIYAIAAFFAATSVHAQDPDETPTENFCKNLTAKPITMQSPSGPLNPAALPTCNEQDLYYGFSASPDYAAALQCGWYQEAHPQTTSGNMFYGPGILTMLYANGEGVSRNYDLAIRFACENTWAAPAELSSRIPHLQKLQAARVKSHFDMCDDTTSGLSEGACAAVDAGKKDRTRAAAITAIANALPPAARAEFPALQLQEKFFEQARSSNEVDMSGTGRAAFWIEEEQRLRDQFLINLQRFGKGDIPPASPADLNRLNDQMTGVYQQLQATKAATLAGSTVTPVGIRKAQRAWVRLADEWEIFAKLAYPDLDPTTIHAQLIRLRLHQLRMLLLHG